MTHFRYTCKLFIACCRGGLGYKIGPIFARKPAIFTQKPAIYGFTISARNRIGPVLHPWLAALSFNTEIRQLITYYACHYESFSVSGPPFRLITLRPNYRSWNTLYIINKKYRKAYVQSVAHPSDTTRNGSHNRS